MTIDAATQATIDAHAAAAFAQPGLLATEAKQVDTTTLAGQANTDLLIAPLANELGTI